MIRYDDIEKILTRFISKDSKVLEIGSNGLPGYLDEFPNLDILRTNLIDLPGVEMIVDAQKPLPFPRSSFDLVFLVATDYYVENIEHMFSEINRVLVPGGHMVNATYKASNLKWQMANQSHAFHAKNWSDYKKIYDDLRLSAHYEIALNNEPTHPIKKIMWRCTPSCILRQRSQWRVHICRKTEGL